MRARRVEAVYVTIAGIRREIAGRSDVMDRIDPCDDNQ
jgi:hypothetical protein